MADTWSLTNDVTFAGVPAFAPLESSVYNANDPTAPKDSPGDSILNNGVNISSNNLISPLAPTQYQLEKCLLDPLENQHPYGNLNCVQMIQVGIQKIASQANSST